MKFNQVETYYLFCIVPVLIYWIGLIRMTLIKKKNRAVFYYKYDDNERYFDWDMFKLIGQRTAYIYLTSFSFCYVMYFCVTGEWLDAKNVTLARGVMIPGLFVFLIDMFKTAFRELRDTRRKKNGEPPNAPPA